MNRSLILMTATRYLVPIILMLSVFILLRGHNEPGGGFVGGLLAASAFALYVFAFGIKEAQRLLGVHPLALIGTGLFISLGSALIAPIFFGEPLMTGKWIDNFELPGIGKLGTPLFFDIGVMLVVVGVTLLIIFALAGEDEQLGGGS